MIKWQPEALLKYLDKTVDDKLELAGLVLEREIKNSMTRGYPPASSPGEPPAIRTGNLKRKVTHKVDKVKNTCKVGILGGKASSDRYEIIMEIGSPKIKPRPYIRPAFEENKDEIGKLFQK